LTRRIQDSDISVANSYSGASNAIDKPTGIISLLETNLAILQNNYAWRCILADLSF
jgi:hypothetical protein